MPVLSNLGSIALKTDIEMKTIRNITFWKSSPSFALISVLALVSLAALTATAFLASARLERQASSSIGKTTLLDMALNSGKFCVTALINDYLQSDLGNTAITTYWRTNWIDELGYPFIGQVKTSGNDNATWYYVPLFSPAGLTNLGTNNIQNAMRLTNAHQGTFSNDMRTYMSANATNGFINNPGLNHPRCVQIPLLGGRTSPPVGWVYMNQEKRRYGSNITITSPAVRIAWFTEDLEGLIDADRMGAATTRSTGTNSEEVSLSSATGTNGQTLVSSISTFTNARKAFLSYGLLSSPNISGLTSSNSARYFATGLRAWAPTSPVSSNGALAWIPIGIPIGGSSGTPQGYTNQGYTKFNLNNLATNSGSAGQAVTNIARIITSNLSTNFLARAGGLTNAILYNSNDFDYAKCLAANIVDYIDTDSTPTALDAAEGYRGTEVLPYCTEFALRFRIEDGSLCDDATNNLSTVPANNIRPSINAYLELWNPHAKNIPLSTLGISFKSYGTNPPTSEKACAIGCNQFIKTIDQIATNYQNGSAGSLSNLTFTFSTAIAAGMVKGITSNSLSSNAYCVIKLDHTHEKLYPGPVSSNNWLAPTTVGGNYKFIYSGTTNTDRFVYISRNTTNFSNACKATPRGGNGDLATIANLSECISGILELSFSNVVYYRSRNISINNPILSITNPANNGNKYQSYLLGFDVSPTGSPYLNTGDPRITYFLRHPSNSTLANNNTFTNTSFGGPNTNSKTVNPANPSFSSPPPTNCKVDITQWPDGGHNPTIYGVNPSGGSAAEWNGANEPISNSIVATESNKAPAFIRNGPMTNILELGNIYDPILWRGVEKGNITTNSTTDARFGGGNTLRIGRPEHPRFAFTNMYRNSTPSIPNMAMSSAALLDLFCITNGTSATGGSTYSLGGGKINLNTAPAPVLRALAGGVLLTNDSALVNNLSAVAATHSVPAGMTEAFAQGVMRFRSKYPFLTPSHLCFIGTDPTWPNTNSWPNNAVFGNTNTIALDNTAPGNNAGGSTKININEWNDQAAEEWFSKIYALSSCQSQNFRIYVVAQLVATNSSGQTNAIGPLVKKYYQVFFQNGSTVTSTPNLTYVNNTIYTWMPNGSCIDIYKSDY